MWPRKQVAKRTLLFPVWLHSEGDFPPQKGEPENQLQTDSTAVGVFFQLDY